MTTFDSILSKICRWCIVVLLDLVNPSGVGSTRRMSPFTTECWLNARLTRHWNILCFSSCKPVLYAGENDDTCLWWHLLPHLSLCDWQCAVWQMLIILFLLFVIIISGSGFTAYCRLHCRQAAVIPFSLSSMCSECLQMFAMLVFDVAGLSFFLFFMSLNVSKEASTFGFM